MEVLPGAGVMAGWSVRRSSGRPGTRPRSL